MTDIRQQLLAIFEIEQRDHLAVIRALLHDHAAGQPADLMEVFRRAHSLKGAARAVDLPTVEDLAHRIETLLSRAVKEGEALSAQVREAIGQGLDAIEDIVAAVMGQRSLPDTSATLALLARLVDGDRGGAVPGQSGETKSSVPSLSTATGPSPPVPQPAAGTTARPSENGDPRQTVPDRLSMITMSMDRVEAVARAATDMSRAIRLHRRVDELQAEVQREFERLEAQWSDLDVALRNRSSSDLGQLRRNLQLQLERLGRQLSRCERELKGVNWEIDHVSHQLSATVEELGMVPARTVFSGFASMMREIGREEGRQIAFTMEGLDQEADLLLLQALKDPVMHVLRNAVRHGGDDPDARRRAGKPDSLQVVLRVSTSGSNLVIEVEDDGRGIDFQRIRALAVERGLIQHGDESLGEEDLASLLFQPGFSTSDKVDRIAGRGLGLAIVEQAVGRLQGTVALLPRNPHGCRALLQVPLSQSRQNVLVVTVGGNVYGLPTSTIERVIHMRVDQIVQSSGRPVVELELNGRKRAVDVVPLASLLEGGSNDLPSENDRVRAVVLAMQNDCCALAVETVEDVAPHVIESPELLGVEPGLCAGVMVREDGRPALVINPSWLLAKRRGVAGRLPAISLPQRGRASQRTILVVDDSLTTRTLERNVLESQGFRVKLSVDGIDALELLRQDHSIDLVVADVEMPRLDGFGLLAAMKNDAALEQIPIILMTSRDDDADIKRGLDLGADAYLTKQKFDQRELLATINQLL